ncbi:unnamed protein product, partial [Didymodactylos carnosus]
MIMCEYEIMNGMTRDDMLADYKRRLELLLTKYNMRATRGQTKREIHWMILEELQSETHEALSGEMLYQEKLLFQDKCSSDVDVGLVFKSTKKSKLDSCTLKLASTNIHLSFGGKYDTGANGLAYPLLMLVAAMK